MTETDYAAVRQKNLAYLNERGFRVADTLPLGPRPGTGSLRPPIEIARRLWALECLFAYVAAPTKSVPTMKVCKCMLRNDLRRYLTQDELYVLDGWRSTAQRRHVDTVGWRLENMLPLGWILGFEVPLDVDGVMLEGEPAQQLVSRFVGSLEQNASVWLRERRVRSEHEVLEREDLFYCTHNAVRSAQSGDLSAVPAGFDPITAGAVIAERRHALTWAISPDVAWEDTDLST